MLSLFNPRNFSRALLFLVIIHITPGYIFAQLLSFPGAEGYGKYSAGGRGGKVYKVTNLNDSGPGSLREAVREKGARIIIFEVSGNIKLESPLGIHHDSVTIAGQTAPGEGICIQNYPFTISANHVVIRYLRFRMGDLTKYQDDALNGINGNSNIIIDHCSVSWGIDEVMSFWNVENITVQWCIISESLNSSIHEKGNHGYGGIWGGTNSTYHHNLIAHHTSRTPRFSGGSTTASHNVDFINNVIYNWGYNSVYGGEKGSINVVGNYYKPGPGTLKKVKNRIAEPWSSGKWFITNNFMEGDSTVTFNNWKGGVNPKDSEINEIKSPVPVSKFSFENESPQSAYCQVLKHAGASLPVRDNVDRRIINEVKSGKAIYQGRGYSKEYKLPPHQITGMIDSQEDVGGWPELNSLTAPVDSDNDGIPDEWEIRNNLNPSDPSDGNLYSEIGSTLLENYINSIGDK
jgi:pectate lyase